MNLKRDLWYYEPALATSGPASVIPTLAIAFPMANFTYIPNFSLLGPSNGPE